MKGAFFVRVLTLSGVETCIDILTQACGEPLGNLLERGEGLIRCHAPDGDLVFSALEKTPNTWLCQLHKEVFQ